MKIGFATGLELGECFEKVVHWGMDRSDISYNRRQDA